MPIVNQQSFHYVRDRQRTDGDMGAVLYFKYSTRAVCWVLCGADESGAVKFYWAESVGTYVTTLEGVRNQKVYKQGKATYMPTASAVVGDWEQSGVGSTD